MPTMPCLLRKKLIKADIFLCCFPSNFFTTLKSPLQSTQCKQESYSLLYSIVATFLEACSDWISLSSQRLTANQKGLFEAILVWQSTGKAKNRALRLGSRQAPPIHTHSLAVLQLGRKGRKRVDSLPSITFIAIPTLQLIVLTMSK